MLNRAKSCGVLSILLGLLATFTEATFSIIAKEKGIGLYGLAVTSRSSGHVSSCLYVDPHRRFVMTAQMRVEQLGMPLTKKLDAMNGGKVTGKAIIEQLKNLIDALSDREEHQYGIVTFDDEYFQFTGDQCCFETDLPHTTQGNQVVGAGKGVPARFLVAVQANIVAQDSLIEMLHGFQQEPLGSDKVEDTKHEEMALRSSLLGLRLLSALRGGQEAGGDMRHWPKGNRTRTTYNSAAFVVVSPGAQPLWVFEPASDRVGVDSIGNPFNHTRPDDVVDSGVVLEELRHSFIGHVKPTLESHGVYELATTPRWPWAHRQAAARSLMTDANLRSRSPTPSVRGFVVLHQYAALLASAAFALVGLITCVWTGRNLAADIDGRLKPSDGKDYGAVRMPGTK